MTSISYSAFPTDYLDINITTTLNYDAEKRTSHSQNVEDYYIFSDNELFFTYYLNDIITFKGGYDYNLEFFQDTNKIYNQQTHAVFFGGEIDLDVMAGIDITTGVRGQINLREASGFTDTKPLYSLSPEIGLVLKPYEFLAIKAHAGHSFKAPDLTTAFRDYFDHTWFYVAPNPDLLPESSWGYSTAIELSPMKNLMFSIGAFRNDLKNLIVYDEDTGLFYNSLPLAIPTNIGKAYTYGATFTTRGNFNIKSLGEIDYSLYLELLRAREVLDYDEKYISKETGEAFNPNLENRPQYSISGSIGWYKKELGTRIKITGYYYGEGYEYEETSDGSGIYIENRTPIQTSMDIRISQEIPLFSVSKNIENVVYFEVKNLLNSVYDSDFDGDTDRRERHFIVGFDLTF